MSKSQEIDGAGESTKGERGDLVDDKNSTTIEH